MSPLCLLLLGGLPVAASAPPATLRYWFDGDGYGTVDRLGPLKGIANLGLVVGKPTNTKACGSAFCDPSGGDSVLVQMQQAFDQFGVPSVAYAEMDCGGCGLGIMDKTPTSPPGPGVIKSMVGLDSHWQRNLDAFAAELAPFIANGSCAGIFICDECMSAGINYTAYDAVVSRFRSHFPRSSSGSSRRSPIIMANDALTFWRQMKHPATQKIPAGPDYWSFDFYDGFNINASWEVAVVKATYEAELFPRLHRGQRVFVVPGVFGCIPGETPGHTIPSMAAQAATVVDKLQKYVAWAATEPRIIGIHSWHFRNRSHHARERIITGGSNAHSRRPHALPSTPSSLSVPPGETQCGPVLTRPGHVCSATEYCCEAITLCLPRRIKAQMGSLCIADPTNKILHAGHCPAWMGAASMPKVVAAMRQLSPAKG